MALENESKSFNRTLLREMSALNLTMFLVEGRLNDSATVRSRQTLERIENQFELLRVNLSSGSFNGPQKEVLANGFLNLRESLLMSMQTVSENEQESLKESVEKILSGLEVELLKSIGKEKIFITHTRILLELSG